jgi:hypothetical protein
MRQTAPVLDHENPDMLNGIGGELKPAFRDVKQPLIR